MRSCDGGTLHLGLQLSMVNLHRTGAGRNRNHPMAVFSRDAGFPPCFLLPLLMNDIIYPQMGSEPAQHTAPHPLDGLEQLSPAAGRKAPSRSTGREAGLTEYIRAGMPGSTGPLPHLWPLGEHWPSPLISGPWGSTLSPVSGPCGLHAHHAPENSVKNTNSRSRK